VSERRKIILWSIALFFGCSILFRGIDGVVGDGSKVTSLAIQLGALVVIVGTIMLIARRKR